MGMPVTDRESRYSIATRRLTNIVGHRVAMKTANLQEWQLRLGLENLSTACLAIWRIRIYNIIKILIMLLFRSDLYSIPDSADNLERAAEHREEFAVKKTIW